MPDGEFAFAPDASLWLLHDNRPIRVGGEDLTVAADGMLWAMSKVAPDGTIWLLTEHGFVVIDPRVATTGR